MNLQIGKLLIVSTLIIVLVSQERCQSQTFAIPFTLSQSSPTASFAIDSNGTLSETGAINLSATIPNQYSYMPQMVWFPACGAFRAGYFQLNMGDIGEYSVAFGSNAHGTGQASAAFNQSTSASGPDSVAMGYATSSNGNQTTALGYESIASGNSATAMGAWGAAIGECSSVSGFGNTAIGGESFATGRLTTADGYYSIAAGYGTTATSYEELVIGNYNTGVSETSLSATPGWWVSSDPVFEIGMGTASTSPADALVVYKNGDVVAAGSIKCAASGDIPMYTGN